MAKTRLRRDGKEYHLRRVVCLTAVPSFEQIAYSLGPATEAKVVKFVGGLGPNCRISKFQWLVVTSESCETLALGLGEAGVKNVLVFSVLVGTDWRFWCTMQGKDDEWEFDGVAAFLQQQLG